jgi:hypothetical protein
LSQFHSGVTPGGMWLNSSFKNLHFYTLNMIGTQY